MSTRFGKYDLQSSKIENCRRKGPSQQLIDLSLTELVVWLREFASSNIVVVRNKLMPFTPNRAGISSQKVGEKRRNRRERGEARESGQFFVNYPSRHWQSEAWHLFPRCFINHNSNFELILPLLSDQSNPTTPLYRVKDQDVKSTTATTAPKLAKPAATKPAATKPAATATKPAATKPAATATKQAYAKPAKGRKKAAIKEPVKDDKQRSITSFFNFGKLTNRKAAPKNEELEVPQAVESERKTGARPQADEAINPNMTHPGAGPRRRLNPVGKSDDDDSDWKASDLDKDGDED
jgi:hypothetical protein